ncbi:MAG: RNA-binding S4 domain-containing protein [Fusobacteria bacterium]|nr:MAG: RNA-binding S4 domain-containing protein [Fusobacteriota bacterium]KAF0229077.1 MAG: RNA-binding S4 domain-containing [Fusobacteriota bacterium]
MEENILKNYIEDQVEKAHKNGIGATKFLTPTEQSEALSYITHHKYNKKVDIIKKGGYESAERARLIFLNKQWGEYQNDQILKALVIEHRKQDKIGHRDILGALMNMGIERNTIGDIETKGTQPTLVCLPEISQYILDNLTKIGNIGVAVRGIPLEELGSRIEELETMHIIASSMRIDCLVAEIFNISRNEASNLIQQGKISLNHKLVTKQDDNVVEGNTIALRGKGKAKILVIDGKTKKDRIKLVIGRYV